MVKNKEISFYADSVSAEAGFNNKIKLNVLVQPYELLKQFDVREILAELDGDEFLELIGEERARAFFQIGGAE